MLASLRPAVPNQQSADARRSRSYVRPACRRSPDARLTPPPSPGSPDASFPPCPGGPRRRTAASETDLLERGELVKAGQPEVCRLRPGNDVCRRCARRAAAGLRRGQGQQRTAKTVNRRRYDLLRELELDVSQASWARTPTAAAPERTLAAPAPSRRRARRPCPLMPGSAVALARARR